MKIKKIWAISFSPTGNTKKIVRQIADIIGAELEKSVHEIDFTLPQNRQDVHHFSEDELVIFGTPVYAGRIPNKILSYVEESFIGNQTMAVPVCVFGNRNFDDALMELRNILGEHGFHAIAAAAVASRHAFSEKIATGRPDVADEGEIIAFAKDIANQLQNAEKMPQVVAVPGNNPVAAYYTPLGLDGEPVKFLKAKPITNEQLCNRCGLCAGVCPMGSINISNPITVEGVCIKCQACVNSCPLKAKHFEDEAFLSHVKMLEGNYTGRAPNQFFLGEMNHYTEEELTETLLLVSSVIGKCEKAQEKFAEGKSQHTLLKNRIKAMYISKALINNEQGKSGRTLPNQISPESLKEQFTKEELTKALPPVTSIISKCEKAQQKFEQGTAHHIRFQNIIKAMYISKALIEDAITWNSKVYEGGK